MIVTKFWNIASWHANFHVNPHFFEINSRLSYQPPIFKINSHLFYQPPFIKINSQLSYVKNCTQNANNLLLCNNYWVSLNVGFKCLFKFFVCFRRYLLENFVVRTNGLRPIRRICERPNITLLSSYRVISWSFELKPKQILTCDSMVQESPNVIVISQFYIQVLSFARYT